VSSTGRAVKGEAQPENLRRQELEVERHLVPDQHGVAGKSEEGREHRV
jgi:hypothetical protein